MPEMEWGKPRLPDQLETMLAERRSAQPETRWWIRTDAKCTDGRIGSLLARYLFRELNERDRLKFEQHVGSCIACGAAIHDAFELRRDFKSRCSKP